MNWLERRRSRRNPEGHPRGRPPHPDVLTPAEWRVLEHVRRGRSNPEIAAALGVSVNTVRAQVSSMLAKLDLRDRHELSAWEGEPAPAPARRSPLLAPLGWLASRAEVVAVSAVAGVLVAGFVVAMQSGLLTGSEPEPPPAGAPTEPPAEQTATPTASATPTPLALQALFPRLTVGPPVELPEDIALYVWDGCTGCDTPSVDLRRFERSGGVVQEQSLFPGTINTPYIFSGWVEDDALYIAECSAGYCGRVGERTADAAMTLYRSLDAGATWESLGTQAVSAGLVVANPDPANWGVTSTLPVAQPTAVDGVWEVGGVELDLRAIDPRGTPSASGTPGYALYDPVSVDDRGWIAVRWFVSVSSRQSLGYFTVFEADGTPLVTYESSYGSRFAWIDADRLVTTVVYDPNGLYQSPDIDYGWIPSIIDLRDSSVRPILDPFGNEPSNRNTVVGVRVE